MKQKIDQVAVGLIDAGQLTITEQLARLHGEASELDTAVEDWKRGRISQNEDGKLRTAMAVEAMDVITAAYTLMCKLYPNQQDRSRLAGLVINKNYLRGYLYVKPNVTSSEETDK